MEGEDGGKGDLYGFVVVIVVFCSSFLFGKRWVMYVMLRYLQVVKA